MNTQDFDYKRLHLNGSSETYSYEDLVSVIALKKTVAFALYSLIPVLITLVVSALDLSLLNQFTESQRRLLGVYTLITLEGILMALVVKGYLPQTRVDIAETIPFNERQLEWGVLLSSVVPWLFFGFDYERFVIFSQVTNTILMFLILVFFITKSWLSKKIRWGVLGVLLLPALHCYYLWDK